MDSSPIGGPFHAPISPWSRQEAPPLKGVAGEQLFEQTSQFYAWYLSWDAAPSEHAATFERLSQIMRIAQVSKEGGNYLSGTEERGALEGLSSLRENLFNGNIRHQEIQTSLQGILKNLTDSNPKARLVSLATQLEYILCIHPSPNQSEEGAERDKQLLSHIISQITPAMPDVHAHAISQGLSKILDNPEAIPNIHLALHEAIRGWL